MNYADPFGVQETTPLNRALRDIELQANMQLNWPVGYLGADYLASINLVNPATSGLSVNLPDALGANEGTGFLMVNIGQFLYTVNDVNRNQVTTVDVGQAKYIFCEELADGTGLWRTLTFGQGTSIADAIELAGNGLHAIGGLLNMAMSVSTTASNFTVTTGHRAKIIVNNGGSVTATLPQYTDAGNDYFVGFHNGGSGTMTIQPQSGNTLDGYTSMALAPNESLFAVCSGTAQWYTIGYGRSTQFQFTKLVKDVSAGGSITLTSAEASNKLLQFIGTPASNTTIIVPSVVGIYYVQNTYTGAYSLTIQTSSGSGISLNAGDRAIVYCDGVNVVSAQSVAVGVNISVIDGSLNSPAVAFSSDTSTGLYKADLHTLGITSNGAEAAQFSAAKSSVTGFFGIGTVTPTVQLHVNAGAAEGVRIQGTGSYLSFFSSDDSVRNGFVQGNTSQMLYRVDDGVNGLHDFYIGAAKMMELSTVGLKVYGTIADASGNNYATLGNNTFTGLQIVPVQRGKIKQLGNVSGTLSIDVSQANTFTMTCTAATTINFTGAPSAGQDQAIYLKVTNGNITWGSMCLFNNSGLRPTATASGRDVFAVWYDPEIPAYVVGRAYQDYK